MTSYHVAVTLHLTAGVVALITFWSNGLMKKGGPLHRRVGQVYLLAMLTIIISGVPLVFAMLGRGDQLSAIFLTYLLVLVSNSCWNSWRSVRDRRDVQRYFGPMYWTLAIITAACGIAMMAIGIAIGQLLFAIFGSIGVVGLITSMMSYRRAAHTPNWWLREHYAAMIGNGVATHIAFLAIGLRNALPGVDPMIQQNLAWFGPLLGAIVAAVWLNRKYGRAKARPVLHVNQDGQAITIPSP
ncbi:MAG: hypothetical protein ACT4NL_16010 [Pseudomarimonas sp.]